MKYLNNFESFNESVDTVGSPLHTAIKNKSKQSGISMSILKEVYKRGAAAWNSGHRAGVAQQQWAFGRLNSFITGKGGARKSDSDLWEKVEKKEDKKKRSKKKK